MSLINFYNIFGFGYFCLYLSGKGVCFTGYLKVTLLVPMLFYNIVPMLFINNNIPHKILYELLNYFYYYAFFAFGQKNKFNYIPNTYFIK